MKNLFPCLAVLGLLYPLHAEAQDKPVLDPVSCRQLMVDYQAPADINQNATYQQGVDVHGKPVVEADINPSAITVPEVITFPLTVDVARYAHLPRPVGTEMDAPMGVVSINTKTNQITYNGQPVESASVTALKELCPQEQPANPILQGQNPRQDILKGNLGNQDILKGKRGDRDILEGDRGDKPILQGDLPAMPR